MKVTLIRDKQDTGTEAISTCEAEAFAERIKTETKEGHITALRTLPDYTGGGRGSYEHINKLPRVCPAVEYSRRRSGERIWKRYNGVVLLEINRLASIAEVEMIKEQAALLP